MKPRQALLRLFYPLLMRFSPAVKTVWNGHKKRAPQPFHRLQLVLHNGQPFSFESLAGKKVLLVNTAGNCGYTAQLGSLQKLQEQYGDSLQVIGFPSNEFKEQEKGSDSEIATFCSLNYGVTFPLSRKTVVLPGPGQHPVYRWLTDREANGWNEQAPTWNFSKYLVDEEGTLLAYFDPGIDPLSHKVRNAIQAGSRPQG